MIVNDHNPLRIEHFGQADLVDCFDKMAIEAVEH